MILGSGAGVFCQMCSYSIFLSLGSVVSVVFLFCFQAEDGIRDLVRSRGLGDVYKRQMLIFVAGEPPAGATSVKALNVPKRGAVFSPLASTCLLYTSDAADERSRVDLGGRRILKKKTRQQKT